MPWSEPISAGEREINLSLIKIANILNRMAVKLDHIEAKLEPRTLGGDWVEVSTVKERAEGQRRFIRSD